MKKRLFALALALCAGLTVPAAAVADKNDPLANYSYQTILNTYGTSYVIKSDGSLWAAGYFDALVAGEWRWQYSEKFVKVMDGVKSIYKSGSGSNSGYFVLKEDDSLWTWTCDPSENSGNEHGWEPGPTQFVKVMDDVACFQFDYVPLSGLGTYCVVKTDGSLWTWGDYTGDGTAEHRQTPVKVMDHVAAVYPYGCDNGTNTVGGRLTVYAIKDDGTLWGWGDYGACNGDWSTLQTGVSGNVCLKPVKLMDDVVAVTSCLNNADMALCSDGTLWHWGTYCCDAEGSHYIFDILKLTKIMDNVAAIDGDMILKKDGSLWAHDTDTNGTFTPIRRADNVVREENEGCDIIKADGTLWISTADNGWEFVMGNVVDCSRNLMLRGDGSVWAYRNNLDLSLGLGDTCRFDSPIKVLDHVRLPSKTNRPEPGSPFADVRSSQYFYAPVKWAVAEGITTGTSSTTFSPDQTCTRGQIITFLWRAAGSPEPQNTTPFSDVKADAYYAKATAWAAEQGLENGSTFSPDAPCTRAMAVEFMWKTAGSPSAPAGDFADVPATAEYADAVAWALKEGVTNGTGPTTFSPDNTDKVQ